MNKQQLLELRDRLHMHDEIPESALQEDGYPYYRPAEGTIEYQYMMERRRTLGGSMPRRTTTVRRPIVLPAVSTFAEMRAGSGGNAVSTTMGFTRLLRNLCRDPQMGERVVPIIPDEGRTFGMDSLFKELEIYASQGQKYEPVDHDLLLSYAEDSDGQILEEGITEAGSMASFMAAATSYATRGVPMIPFYTFYSMFGFQRIGDLIWQAADMRARGFLMGATAGRTTLLGEGLQHQDGHSLLLASTVPSVQAFDPAFAYEVGAIVRSGIERMYGPDVPDSERDVMYYLTLYNENYQMPALDPERAAEVEEGVVRGLYRFADAPEGPSKRATILFSGISHGAARAAANELAEHYDVAAELWSATSYKSLREEALAAERWNRLHPSQERRTPLVTQLLDQSQGPITAVSDFMRMVPEQIGRFVPEGRPFTVLGTDGMGRSDTREALRRFFEIDMGNVVVGVLTGLLESGQVDSGAVDDAIKRYDIDPDASEPFFV